MKHSQYANNLLSIKSGEDSLRGNIRFIRTVIRRVGPLFWLLGPMYAPPSIINTLLLATALWLTLPLNPVQAKDVENADQLISINGTKKDRSWTLISQRSYEDTNPGGGTSKGYKSDAGTITVYTYDLGFSDWQEGISDLRLIEHMDDVRSGVLQSEKQGTYRNVKLEPVETLQIDGQDFLYFDAHIDMKAQRVWSAAHR